MRPFVHCKSHHCHFTVFSLTLAVTYAYTFVFVSNALFSTIWPSNKVTREKKMYRSGLCVPTCIRHTRTGRHAHKRVERRRRRKKGHRFAFLSPNVAVSMSKSLPLDSHADHQRIKRTQIERKILKLAASTQLTQTHAAAHRSQPVVYGAHKTKVIMKTIR